MLRLGLGYKSEARPSVDRTIHLSVIQYSSEQCSEEQCSVVPAVHVSTALLQVRHYRGKVSILHDPVNSELGPNMGIIYAPSQIKVRFSGLLFTFSTRDWYWLHCNGP